MKKNELKIMLSIMREINDGNEPKASDYELDKNEFWNIIEKCQDAGYIKGANASTGGRGNKAQVIYLNTAKLTVSGLKYLKENSALMRTYRGLKSFREWVK